MIEKARNFLRLFEGDDGLSKQDRVLTLAKALDELSLAYHQTPDGKPGRDCDPERFDTVSPAARDPIVSAFPDFGYYPSCMPAKDIGDPAKLMQPPTLGDAIDDLLDIRAEMSEVVWRWENIGADDAAWHFRRSYEYHWGRHLLDVRSYIHMLLFEV